tara:strand:+ start:192 stop:395 length:204 start_codon:yes stop_codon:yes gene_type:complete
MAEDRYTALTSGLKRSTGTHSLVNTRTFRDTVLELPNNMELGAFIREWINENPENGSNIKYLNTDKK